MAKVFRRFIRINGRVKGSPEFDSKKAADEWYEREKEKRKLIRKGRLSPDSPTFLMFTAAWIQGRMENYGPETWGPDNQRLRAYLLPELADYKLDSITRAKCRAVLELVVTKHGRSRATRQKVQALLSKIFNDALNHDPPFVTGNPVSKLTFSEKRVGRKLPAHLEDEDETIAFMQAALEVGDMHFVMTALVVFAGLRKSELIGLTWRSVRWRSGILRVTQKYVQARREVIQGTKSGEETHRDIPVPERLFEILKAWRERSPHHKESDFVLFAAGGKNKGGHVDPRVLHDMVDEVRRQAGRKDIGLHSLRHTYGRLFVQRTGNPKALQKILGHASSSTTDIYSEMSSRQVKPFAEAMTLDVPNLSDATDTQMTRKSEVKR